MRPSKRKRAKRPPSIAKSRREHFGALIFRERPPFLAQVNHTYADSYNIPALDGAIFQEGVFSAPVDAHLALTTRCNMSCVGCYSTRGDEDPEDIPFERAQAIIDKLSEMGCFSLSFGGGEPTIHPDLFEVAAYARAKQVLPNMTTNGLTMTEDFAEKCSVFGNVHFSIHALQDMDHVFTSMRTYRRATGNGPGLNLLLTTETLAHLDEILTASRKAGVSKILFLRYKTTVKNSDIKKPYSYGELKKLPALLKGLSGANRRMMFLFDCSLFELMAQSGFSDMDHYRLYDCNGCMGGNANIAIDVWGFYRPCSFWHEPFGHMSELSFESWIHNPRQKEFREMRKGASCLSCEFEELCHGGCRLLYPNRSDI